MDSQDSRSYSPMGVDSPPMGFALTLSFIGHVVLFTAFVLAPDFSPPKKIVPTIINVSMVTLPSPGKPATAAEPVGMTPEPVEPAPSEPAPEPPEPVTEPPEPAPEPPKKPAVTIERTEPLEPKVTKPVPLEPKKTVTKPKPKYSLKKKTYKPKQVVRRAIKKIEKKVEDTEKDPLKSAFDRLKRKVATQPQPSKKPASTPAAPKTASRPAPSPGGIPGGSEAGGVGGGRAAQLIDIYRVQIAFQIQQNWAFSEQLAGRRKDQQASLVFKVMPNGQIQDVFFTDRSGNKYLDDSAYKAIMKSNPLKPHPQGVVRPYVEVGLRFTPEGIQ